MNSLRRLGLLSAVPALLLSLGCGSGGGNDAPSGTSSSTPAVPGPATAHPVCIVSADCPAGEHCDLGECVQDCNTQTRCSEGRSCSARARCLGANERDIDPIPSTQYAGALDVSPHAVRLTQASKSLDLTLTARSANPVRYRIVLSGPHLSVDAPRGEFTGTTKLHVMVDSSKLTGRDVAGSIRILTTLGDAVIDAPIHVGLTGAYRGVLRYANATLDLGSTKLGLDVIEDKGNVKMRVDSASSLLFPATSAGEVTGTGQYTASDGLDVTVRQVIDKDFGAARNRFRRAVGRSVRLRLKPDADGNLQGTFDETVAGVFGAPITTSGSAFLGYVPQGKDPAFSLSAEPSTTVPPPDTKTALSPSDVFQWNVSDCATVVCTCGDTPSSPGTLCLCLPSHAQADLDAVGGTYSAPLYTAMSSRPTSSSSSLPLSDLAASCRASFAKRSVLDWYADSSAHACGLLPKIACGLELRAQKGTSDLANGLAAVRMVQETLAPALLVAKDEVVHALSDSFSAGPLHERDRYDAALSALAPATVWVVQPLVLEYLRALPAQAARGDNTALTAYPAAYALADLFNTTAVIDGERARLGTLGVGTDEVTVRTDAQRRALLGYLEALIVTELARTWGTTVPATVTSRLTGLLTPLDQGFSALLQGANAFGVPAGIVPFVYRPEDAAKAPTNFEQVLSMANDAIGAERALEQSFLVDKRTCDANQSELSRELASVRGQYDTQIRAICGASFDPNTVTGPSDWARCGASDQGSAGDVAAELRTAHTRIQAARGRSKAMADKISIDSAALKASQAVHQQNLRFIDANGQALELNAFNQAEIAAEEAYNSAIAGAEASFGAQNLLGAAAEASAAAANAFLGEQRAELEQERQRLQTAQTMHAEQSITALEYINGMAAIQKEIVDECQLGLETMVEESASFALAVKQRNLVAQAMSLDTERRRALGVVNADPANDPSYRLLRDKLALDVIAARVDAQRQLYFAARALEYEVNASISTDGAILGAHDATSLDSLKSCLGSIFNGARLAYGTPQEYTTDPGVSVRKLLGITGPRIDAVTGQALSEGEQFREILLRNQNLDGRGGVGLEFSTNLLPGNGLWPTDVCMDRIKTVQAQLVGDFLGDNQAQVNLSLSGGAVMRACDSDTLVSWSMGDGKAGEGEAFAVIQAGVNTFGSAPPNFSLFGQSVARASWRLQIPGGKDAPTNADVDLTHIEDILLKLTHVAPPRKKSPVALDLSCLSRLGGAP